MSRTAPPPSRAYLKLWELFTLLDQRPGRGDFCLDLGASPGGWTWVLQRLGAQVLSVDKAPLDPSVARLPNVEERHESAFALEPRSVGRVDWLFSDVICYPTRLLALVKKWLEAGTVRRFACTISSRVRRISRRCGRSRQSRTRGFSTSTTTSTS